MLQTLEGSGGSRGFLGIVSESFAGAWQRGITVDAPRDVLAFSAVYACVTTIADDISKLDVLLEEEDGGVFGPVSALSPYWAVLRRPNHYQNWGEFCAQWIISKLLWGNAYVLKQRDQRGIVTAMYVLDPQRVQVLITDSGDVYYRLSRDDLAGVSERTGQESSTIVPASEIIHDKMPCLWHSLVGVSPIYACGMTATMGNRIQRNSTQFFGNFSMPSGILTSDQKIDDTTANEYKRRWQENYSGANIGKVAVLGGGLKYAASAMPADDAQLVEQLKWTVEDVARAFKMPLYKISGALPNGASLGALDQGYYNHCLFKLIKSMERCLKDGLELPQHYCANIDESGLLRMDMAARYDANTKGIAGGWLTPNEARLRENLAPVVGGDTPYLQQQNYSLEDLDKRSQLEDPFATAKPAPALPAPREPAEDDDEPAMREAREFLAHLAKESAWT